MEKVSTYTEEQKVDAEISEKRVTKNYLRKKFKNKGKRTERRDTHHRRNKLVKEDPDLGSSNKDMKLAKLSDSDPHNIVISWLLMGRTSHIFK